MKVEIVPATLELIQRYYGCPPPFSVKALIAKLEGIPAGIGGLQMINGVPWAFSEMNATLRRDTKNVVRCVQAMRPLLAQFEVPVYAVAELESGPLLMHLGFRPTGDMARIPLIAGGELAGTVMVRH